LTKTATFDWNKLNPKIKFSFTKKKFFNECYFRLNYNLPGARLMTYYQADHDISLFDKRVENHNKNLYKGRRQSYIRFRYADIRQLVPFANVYHGDYKTCQVRFRIESDILSIYSDSEEFLYNLASKDLANWTTDIISFSSPENQASLSLLDQGFVIVSKPQTHPYKVKLKETFGLNAERKFLATYLQGLGTDVKVTKYILEHLSREHKYFPAGYIYVNDVRLVDMLRLVSPNLVGSVQQLVTQ